MEKQSLSLNKIIHGIWKGKYIIIICMVICTLFGILFTKFVYNKTKTIYSSTFEYSFDGIELNKYPSNQDFNYKKIISEEAMKSVIEEDSSLSSINLKGIIEKNGISIAPAQNTIYVNGASSTEIIPNTYTIYASAKYFKSGTQAKTFISKLSSKPYEKALFDINNLNFNQYMLFFDDCQTYEEQIDLLTNQYQYLIDQYDKILDAHGDVWLTTEDNVFYSISSLKINLENYYQTIKLYSLKEKVLVDGYVKNYDNTINSINTQIEYLTSQIAINASKINSLTDQIGAIIEIYSTHSITVMNSDYSDYNKEISALLIQNVELEKQKTILEKKRDSGTTSTETENLLTSYKARFNQEIETYKSCYKKMQLEYSSLKYNSLSIIESSNEIKLAYAGVASIFIGLFLSVVLVGLKNKIQYVKEEN